MDLAKLFVVVVTYNGKEWYDRCFQSLRNSLFPLQTIVVDNASSDDTLEYIKAYYPEVILIESTQNIGFGQGNNIGIRYALSHGADYVFLLNQDAWIEPNAISELVNIQTKNQDYGILSPVHINADMTSIEKGLMHYIANYKITSTDLINDLYFQRIKDVYQTTYVNAAAWLLPKITLETIGGFDPIFFHYGEDDNYMHRVQYHNLKIGICPNIRVVHDTEKRLTQTSFSIQTSYKSLLVDFCNINENKSFSSYYLFALRKILSKILKMNFAVARIWINDFRFIVRNQRNISLSRKTNITRDSNWL